MSERGSSKWRSFLLPNPRLLIAGLAILAGILPFVGWVGGDFWFFDLFNHFQVQYAAFLCVCVGILCLLRAFRLAGLVVVFAVLPVFSILPEGGVEKRGNSGSVRVTTFNVLSSNTRYQKALEWIGKSEADVVFLPETTREWTAGLISLRTTYPYVVEHYERGNFGLALYSKLPLVSSEILFSGELQLPLLKARLKGEDKEFMFFGAHPMPPVGAGNALDRDRYLQDLAAMIKDETLPVVIAGDFNATRWSHGMRPLFDAGLRDAGGKGFPQATWQRKMLPIALPIDMILYRGEGISTDGFEIGPDLGSDHRPVTADIRW